MNNRFAHVSIACLSVAGCALNRPSAALLDSEVIAAQLTEIFDIAQSDLSAKEMADRHISFFAEAPTILPADQAAILGFEAVADLYYEAYREIEFVSNTYRDLVIDVHGEMATRRYIGTGAFRLAEQSEPVVVTNRYLDILIREDDEWKILLHSWVPVSW